MRSPVSQEDWSDARNSATRAISSGWPSRPSGMGAPIAFATSSEMPSFYTASVPVMPGAMALTRILRSASSFARPFVMASTALFEAE